MAVSFSEDVTWISDKECVMLWANDNHRKVRCFITRQVFDDRFNGVLSSDYVALYKTNKAAINSLVEKSIRKGLINKEDDLIVTIKHL